MNSTDCEVLNVGCFLDYNILIYFVNYRSRGSSVSIVTDYGLDDRGSIPDRSIGFFFESLRSDRLWGPPNLVYDGYRG
jgi:hypothetical protein